MKRSVTITAAAIFATVAIAGCGDSSKSSGGNAEVSRQAGVAAASIYAADQSGSGDAETLSAAAEKVAKLVRVDPCSKVGGASNREWAATQARRLEGTDGGEDGAGILRDALDASKRC